MSGFTKGKWKYSEKLQQVTAYPEGPGNWLIVGGFPTYPDEQVMWKEITGKLCWNGDETDANGRLIAAAPEMYELLKIWTEIQAQPTLMEAQKKAQELLAYIDGEEAEE